MPGVTFRRVDESERDRIFPHKLEGVGDWLLEADGEIVATGGVYLHYNPPYGDISMEVDERFWRRRLRKLSGAGAEAHVLRDGKCSRRAVQRGERGLAGDVAEGRVPAVRKDTSRGPVRTRCPKLAEQFQRHSLVQSLEDFGMGGLEARSQREALTSVAISGTGGLRLRAKAVPAGAVHLSRALRAGRARRALHSRSRSLGSMWLRLIHRSSPLLWYRRREESTRHGARPSVFAAWPQPSSCKSRTSECSISAGLNR